MSGFVGVLARDDLGQARFATDPASSDGRYSIAGDIRLDARDELIAALPPHAARGDAALVLEAYRTWGPDCLSRLHGDFSFALWDAREQRLFCARDRFGVRPFFYAAKPGVFVCSNTLAGVRRHPAVGSAPYEPVLADFLVCGTLLEADRSFFADIRRLPPGHALTLERGAEPRVARYWDLPVEPELRYARASDYVDEFAELLARAVADRAPPGRVALFLSGGLDSAAIAAVLCGKLGRAPPGVSAQGVCLGWNGVFPDPEPALARRTADALGLPLEVHEFDDATPFTAADPGPEPEDDAYRSHSLAGLRAAAAHAPVVLTGRCGNEIFAPEFLLDELRRAPGLHPLAGALAYWRASGRRPPLGLRALLAPRSRDWLRPPAWLDARWLAGFDLPARLRAFDPPPQGRDRPPRAQARARLAAHRGFTGFEFSDPGATGVPVDSRYPFADERLVRFALRLPAQPWCIDKHLERRALAGLLPDAIVRRPKALLAADPFATWRATHPELDPGWTEGVARLAGRIDLAAWTRAWAAADDMEAWRLARAVALARWLA